MKSFIFLLPCFICITSCNRNDQHTNKNTQARFDKIKWQLKEEDAYPYRNGMLTDLVYNVTLKGLKKDELIDLLGTPTRIDGDYLFYTIAEPHIGILTLSNKSLVIKLNKDGVVEWRKIHE